MTLADTNGSQFRLAESRPEWWTDWREQERKAIRSAKELFTMFPGATTIDRPAMEQKLSERRFQITP